MPDEKTIVLAGNPNVGKSTVFNALTGLKQHTGNWTGKTVCNASGCFTYNQTFFEIVDVPGTYSLLPSSYEEEVARDIICFGESDAIVIVVDATSIERNLNLVLQVLECNQKVVVCINLLDEAEKKKIHIDLEELSLWLGVPVVGTAARAKKGLDLLCKAIDDVTHQRQKNYFVSTQYGDEIEAAVKNLMPYFEGAPNSRWLALKTLENNKTLNEQIALQTQKPTPSFDSIDAYEEKIVSALVKRAEEITQKCVAYENENYDKRDRTADRILTSKATGIPIMLLLLALIFWLTTVGANYPSNLLFSFFANVSALLEKVIPAGIFADIFINGVCRTLFWVVSVMLPPMAIFFPLFTLLEDIGYLPRVAFNLDNCFKKAGAHGKQALTMCMGFGCNACGVTGCRIIDSPRERLIAVLTNNFVPCNGRFPTLITIISMFFVASAFGKTALLMCFVLLGIFMTLAVSKILSKTLLRGKPSSFMLELPPYRVPKVGSVIVRSILDRTLFVLGRAAAVAAPAGLVIWLFANIYVGDMSILAHTTAFFDPFARLFGLDGVIFCAFLLGFPANEIVFPIILMAYLSTGTLTEFGNISALHTLLLQNGWTVATALCTALFSLFHFPCATTLVTIYKETKSIKYTLLSFAIPTVTGLLLCFFVNLLCSILL